MLEIKTSITEKGYHFDISNENDNMQIFFAGNLDLYWNISHGNLLDEEECKTFNITKENYYLFALFDELYQKIENCNVFGLNRLEREIPENAEFIENLKKSYQHSILFHDGIVEWHSDEAPYEEASFVTLEKKDDEYLISFHKGECAYYFTYSVRFSNSGSRYDPFNIIFMNMYFKLQKYDPKFHEVNFEEYLWQRKRMMQQQDK